MKILKPAARGIIAKTLKYGLILIGLFLAPSLVLLSGAYRDLREAAARGLSGKSELSQAAATAKIQNWPRALDLVSQAQGDFSSALEHLDRTHANPAVKYIGPIRNQVDDLEYLLRTAEILSRSMKEVLPIISDFETVRRGSGRKNFGDLPDADKVRLLRMIYESEPELAGLKANLDLAVMNLGRIHRIGVLWPVYRQISEIRTELAQASDLAGKMSPIIKLLPALAGYPETSRFLLLLQNNDELRATGGFIGVYGILETKNGQIVSLKTDDSYHLDMPASQSDAWKSEPPAPIGKYLKVEKWYLRDANWSPDWPTSARKIEEIFNGESRAVNLPGVSFTGLAAITPDFVSDLIGLVGPISVKGTTYDASNFQPLLQYNVEVAYKDQNISSWDRKEIINDLVAELRNRLLALPPAKWLELSTILDRSLSEKNIQIYFPGDSWEALARSLGADGAIKQTDGDYLMVVDSNLGAFKSDAVVKKDIAYSVSEKDRNLAASVRLSYRHEGGFDWRTTRYRSYTRVYAPLGSRLTTLQGVDSANADISVTDDAALGKTVFAFFFTVEPGTAKTIILDYRLPERLTSGNYDLLVQKQAGNRIESLSIDFGWLKNAKGKSSEFTTDLNQDREFTSK